MSHDHDLAALADLHGIVPHFYNLQGQQHVTSPDTQRALLAANGVDVSSATSLRDALNGLHAANHDRWFPHEIIVETGVTSVLNFGLGATWQLCADGVDVVTAEGLPADQITLPPLVPGVYVLTAQASGRVEVVTVLAAPKRLPLIQSVTGHDRLWGMTFALYGVRSKRNLGLGDFSDLGKMATIVADQGAAFLGINPIHNMGFSDLEAISPYSPSHRGFLNTGYVATDAVPGLDQTIEVAGFLQIRDGETVQYADHKRAHNQMLEQAYLTFLSRAPSAAKTDLANFRTGGGSDLVDFARYESLSEIHGPDWRRWPDDIGQVPDGRVDFHIWLQWVANSQVASAQDQARAAGMPLGLYLDLAVGPRRDGAESWCAQDTIANGVSIGAPPDHLSPEGQNWDLAAFSPRKLAAQRYAPLRRVLAQTMRHAGVIRIDHVLGINRSFWIPDDGSPGTYIHQPFESLLAIIKIEAARHNCIVIGEDLGLVPEGFRETMRDHGFYGFSVLQYEKDDQGSFQDQTECPEQVLSCFATHDTPTVKGYEAGRDIDWWQALNWIDEPAADTMHKQRAAEVSAAFPGADFAESVDTMLAGSNAGLVAVQLDDVVGADEAQNLPGTIDQHPNWRRKYGTSLEDLASDDRLRAVALKMSDATRATINRE